MIMKKIYILITVFIFSLSSCKIYHKVNLPKHQGVLGYLGNNQDSINKISTSNQNKLNSYKIEKEFYPNSNEANWGLAMSGGGIRSAAVNIGALKALYDLDILDSIQIMSSVSGGGYALGWFYSNEIHNKKNKLGTSFLDNKSILTKICKLQENANMMRVPTMVKTLFSSPKKTFKKYEEGIQRTFINDSSKNIKLNTFHTYIKGKKPYFIINSTIQSKKNNDWLPRVYENTSYQQGNPELGFLINNDKNSITLEKAITISGAALKFKLLNKSPNYSALVDSDYLPLSDGGHTENLGAISLIRRGVKNIIIELYA
jgi:Patatin-like phospholipase